MRYALRDMRCAFLLFTACASTGSLPPKSQTEAIERPKPSAPISLTYTGVAGWTIESAGTTILVDPYYSRPDFTDEKKGITPDAAAIAKHAPATAQLIVIAHSHIDHLLDAPEVAKRTNAELMGSDSTIRVGKASGVADDKLIQVKGGEDYAFSNTAPPSGGAASSSRAGHVSNTAPPSGGAASPSRAGLVDGFSVRVIPSLHSAIFDKHAHHKPIAEPVMLPLTFAQYEEGGSFAYYLRIAGHEVYIQSSAGFIEREVAGLRPTIAIIAPGLREHFTDYTCRLLAALGKPPIVIATHFDDWQQPAPGGPYDLSDFAKEVEACAPGTRFVVPKHFEPLTF